NAILSLPGVQPNQQGIYRVLVVNAAGSVASSNAILTVAIPARITQQPQNIQAHLGATATFVVQATSSTPITYKWRKNGVEMPGRTASFLTITGVTQADAAVYDVVV